MPQRILGIDIGSYSIKVAEIERSLKTFELVSFYEYPIAYNEALSPEEATAATLEKMVENYALSSGLAYTCLPGSHTATRLIHLPFGNTKKIDQTIEFEIEGYVPFSLEDILIDYHIVESSKTESLCLIGYGKKANMVKHLNLLSTADLEPHFVGCEPVELGNVMKLGIIQPEGPYAVLDLGHTKSNIAIFIGPNLYFARTLSIGGLHLTQAIAKKLQVPLEEAEKLKLEIGQVASEAQDEMTQKVSQALEEALRVLLIEIKQTFMNFQETQGQVVQALYLCGGTSRLAGVDHLFSYELRKNVSQLDCLDATFNRLSDSNWCRPIIPIALALAFRGAHSTKLPDVQFRRGEFAYKGDIRQLGGMGKQVAILAVIIATFVLTSFGINYFALNSKVGKLRKSVAKIAGEVLPETPTRMLENPDSVLSILNGKVLEAQERKQMLVEKFQLSYLNVLLEIARHLPPRDKLKLDVDELNISGDRIRIEGRTYGSFEAVDIIKQAVAKSPLFKNVNTGNVKKGKGETVKFDLTLQINLEGQEADSKVAAER